MAAIAQSRKRQEQAAEESKQLRASAAEQGLSEAEIEARLRAIRRAADADCKAYMSTVDATKRDKHARLVARLAKIKEKEAAELQKLNKEANAGSTSSEDLENRVREIQAKAQADVDEILKATGKSSSRTHERLVLRLEKIKQKQIKAEAMARMQASLDGQSPQGTVAAVDKVRKDAEKEEAQLVTEIMKDESQEEEQTLKDVAVLKAQQGEQIYTLIKEQQSATGETSLSQQDLALAVQRIKQESNDRINEMLKSVGIESDKKHRKLLEKIAERKAKQIAKMDQLRDKRKMATDAAAMASIDSEIQRVEIEAEDDIEDLTQAVADRAKTKGNKSQKRLNKLLDLAVAHDQAQSEMDDMEARRKDVEARATAIQNNHTRDFDQIAADTELAKEYASEKLNKRLMGRRKKRAKALQHDAHAKRQLEKEAKSMDKYQEKKEKLQTLEEEVAKINDEFNQHVKAQTAAMEDEKARQHKNVAARRARAIARRRKTDGGSSNSKSSESGSTEDNGAFRLMRTELSDTVAKAKQRKLQGKSAEEQLQALLADIQLNLAHQNDMGATPGVIKKPRLNLAPPNMMNSKLALAEARDQLKGRLSGQKVSRDSALTVMQNRSSVLNAPELM